MRVIKLYKKVSNVSRCHPLMLHQLSNLLNLKFKVQPFNVSTNQLYSIPNLCIHYTLYSSSPICTRSFGEGVNWNLGKGWWLTMNLSVNRGRSVQCLRVPASWQMGLLRDFRSMRWWRNYPKRYWGNAWRHCMGTASHSWWSSLTRKGTWAFRCCAYHWCRPHTCPGEWPLHS